MIRIPPSAQLRYLLDLHFPVLQQKTHGVLHSAPADVFRWRHAQRGVKIRIEFRPRSPRKPRQRAGLMRLFRMRIDHAAHRFDPRRDLPSRVFRRGQTEKHSGKPQNQPVQLRRVRLARPFAQKLAQNPHRRAAVRRRNRLRNLPVRKNVPAPRVFDHEMKESNRHSAAPPCPVPDPKRRPAGREKRAAFFADRGPAVVFKLVVSPARLGENVIRHRFAVKPVVAVRFKTAPFRKPDHTGCFQLHGMVPFPFNIHPVRGK